ncbi:MAG: YicC/YloC family endoribonuclease [Chromatiales bacterium]|jgi:uncharacterized protein (TIGR00255 family)
MTAFSREESRSELGELVWEIRSVNHRYLESFVRLPEELRALEPLVRERVGKQLARGKLDCALRYKPTGFTPASITVNERLVEQLVAAASTIENMMHEAVPPTTMDMMRWPGVLEAEAVDLGQVQNAALELLDRSLGNLIEVRQREGEQLAEMIKQRLHDMRKQVDIAKQRMPEVIEQLRQRLNTKLADLRDLDPGRLEQEVVLLAQRLDIDEEMDRLTTHLNEVERTLGQNKPIGRRLDFLMQELNREANTLGSKSADTVTTSVSVEMKVLIEQMREQIQNIE